MARKKKTDPQTEMVEALRRAASGMSVTRASATFSPAPSSRVTALSPRHSTNEETTRAAPDLTIDIAFAQFEGWHLGIAMKCLEIPHGAFGALCIAFSYFETIWQLDKGESSDRKSPQAFREGLELVFPALGTCSQDVRKNLADALYQGFRNSFFHNMIVGHNVAIAPYPWLLFMFRNGSPVLALSEDGALYSANELPEEYAASAHAYAATTGDFVCLNPHQFVPALVGHLHRFRQEIEAATDDRKDRFLRGYRGLLGARSQGGAS